MTISPPTVGATQEILRMRLGSLGSSPRSVSGPVVSPDTTTPLSTSVRELRNLARLQHEEAMRGFTNLHQEHDDTQGAVTRLGEQIEESKPSFFQELTKDFMKSGATVAASVLVTFMIQKMMSERRERRQGPPKGDMDDEEEEAGMAEAAATAVNLASVSGADGFFDEDEWEED